MQLAGAAVAAVFLGALACGETAAPDSGFERVGSYLTGAHPVTSAIVDLDSDGDLDVIAPALISEDVVVLINHDGDFEWRQLAPLAMGVSHAIVADVLGDDAVELIVCNRDAGRVAIHRIIAGPELELAAELEVVGATGLEAADLNGDGRTDLIVTSFTEDRIALFLQSGAGLEPAGEILTSDGPYRTTAADVDQDGGLELFVVAARGSRVELFGGGLDGWSERASVATGDWPSSLEVADRDRDGVLDIYGTSNQGDAVFELTLGLSGDAWTLDRRDIASGDGAFAMAMFDSDGSGDLELAVTHKDASAVAILGTDADGPWTVRQELSTGTETGPSPLYVWDYDNDGTSDLLVVNAFTDEVVVYRGH